MLIAIGNEEILLFFSNSEALASELLEMHTLYISQAHQAKKG